MIDVGLRKAIKPPVQNQQLFAEAYLQELLTSKVPVDVPAACRQTIIEWRAEYPTRSSLPGVFAYVGQCLSALSFYPSRRSDGYALFADETKGELLGLCLVVPNEDLGETTKGRHPQARLIRELRAEGLNWGVVTNGVSWRLCSSKAFAPYEVFLEVQLDELLSQPNLTEFIIFHRFFNAEAFISKSLNGSSAITGLDWHLAESDKRIEDIQRYLGATVERVLRSLCLGFVQDSTGTAHTHKTLKEIYQNSIYLLYRILFLFYAEARGLMPVQNLDYQTISIESMVEESRRRWEHGVQNADPHALWEQLTRLCKVVDKGSDAYGVDAYNGGLFSDIEKPYLERHQIGDSYLAKVLYDLSFMPPKHSPRRIDYRDLSVRMLGTLYEGLLEYSLNLVKDEPVVAREVGDKRTYTPQSQAGVIKRGETILEVGEVYFADDKGERRASGSYYTPEDVVQYIVAETVSPKLQECCAAIDRLIAKHQEAMDIAIDDSERRAIQREAECRIEDQIREGILRLRILDPAMGSAHFLVSAGQVMTNAIVEILNRTDWVNDKIDTDPLLWKRRVAERCLYGVDVNPLALELARLALWLNSASLGKPLTFLDHHLKLGNSLYGAPLSKLSSLPAVKERPNNDMFRDMCEQIISAATAWMANITEMDSDHIDDVRLKGELNNRARVDSKPLRDIANVWLASLHERFGDDEVFMSENEYTKLLEVLQDVYKKRDPLSWEALLKEKENEVLGTVVGKARQIAIDEKFFHWELEFLDAVSNGVCQFDVVLGNPPYVGRPANKMICTLYESAKAGDLYSWIFERGLRNVADSGYVSMIVPLSITFSRQLKSLRRLILASEGDTYISSFDASRDGIFLPNGRSRNHQRASIVIHHRREEGTRVYATNLIRWLAEERSSLMPALKQGTLTYTEITAFANETSFPKLGDPRLIDFWQRMSGSPRTIKTLLPKKQKGEKPTSKYAIYTPATAGYFITVTPTMIRETGWNKYLWADKWTRDLALLALNSNVFYWLWCVLGDGFDVTGEVIGAMVLPDVVKFDNETTRLRDRLLNAADECTTFHLKGGKQLSNYNFNKRMDILLDIDAWLVGHIGPDLELPRDIFAQYKSNSFMRLLDQTQWLADGNDVEIEVAE